VQPGQPVLARDPEDVAVREIDETVASHQRALLDVEGAVVRGDRRIDAVSCDCTGQVEEGAGHLITPGLGLDGCDGARAAPTRWRWSSPRSDRRSPGDPRQ